MPKKPELKVLNYTTDVSVHKTVAEIHELLIRAGAKSVKSDYDDDGSPVAVEFVIKTEYGMRGFRLPAKPLEVEKVLVEQYNRGIIPRASFATPEQAERVAWRQVKDALEVQMALLQTNQVTLDQLMLGYMTTGDGRTLFDDYRDDQLLLTEGVK
jgi:hypothetical protein